MRLEPSDTQIGRGKSKPGDRVALLCLCLLFNAAGSAAQSQTVYRQLGPDGTVIFSDRPAQAAKSGSVIATPIQASRDVAEPVSPWAGLPFELRQLATRFPVSLYTTDNCTACSSLRSLLQGRGVPFLEYTVLTPEDGQALRRLSGDTVLPFITIGGQKITGFNERELHLFLDAAAYPKTSNLPASYRQPAAIPLTQAIPNPLPASPRAADPDPVRGAQPADASRPTLPQASPSNPAGIQF